MAARVRESLEQVPAGEVYRLRPAGVPRTAAIDIELSPPPRTPGWRSPVTLTFHYVHWDHGDEAHIAYVPVLGIETITTGAARLAAKLAQDVRAALVRSGAARSLERLTGLQRTRGIEVVESQVAVDVGSPLQHEQGDNRDQPESVLAKVATDLTRERLPPAFES